MNEVPRWSTRAAISSHLLVEEHARRPALTAGLAEDLPRRGRLQPDEGRRARLDDARLLEGDLLQRVAQDVGVLQVQGGDHGGGRGHDVRGVQPAADAHLDDRFRAAGIAEVEETRAA